MHSIFKVAKVGYYRGRKKAVKNVIVEVGFNENPRKKSFRGFCARDWNRTSTSLRTADFESAASTNSATRAY